MGKIGIKFIVRPEVLTTGMNYSNSSRMSLVLSMKRKTIEIYSLSYLRLPRRIGLRNI